MCAGVRRQAVSPMVRLGQATMHLQEPLCITQCSSAMAGQAAASAVARLRMRWALCMAKNVVWRCLLCLASRLSSAWTRPSTQSRPSSAAKQTCAPQTLSGWPLPETPVTDARGRLTMLSHLSHSELPLTPESAPTSACHCKSCSLQHTGEARAHEHRAIAVCRSSVG